MVGVRWGIILVVVEVTELVFVNLYFQQKKMAKRKINREFHAYEFLEDLGLYVSRVQDENHARRGRVAMFWSLASLLYIVGWMQVEGGLHFDAFGISFPGLNTLAALFVVTLWYAVRFGFSVLKIVALVNPWQLWRDLQTYKKLEESEFDFESFGLTVNYYDDVEEFDKLHDWNVGETVLREKYLSREDVANRKKEEEEKRKKKELQQRIARGELVIPDLRGLGLDMGLSTRDDLVDTSQHFPESRIDNADDVRYHNLRHPQIGFWENFVFLMLFPIGVCGVTMLAFLGIFAYHAAKFVMQLC